MTTAILTQWLPPGFVKALSWMLIHSLWQGLALAIIGGIMIQCTKRSSAVVRYTFLLALFISFIAATVITFFVQYNSDGATTASHITTVVSAQTNLAQLQSAPVQLQSSNIDFTHTAIAYVNSYAQYIVLLWLCIFTIQCIKLTGGLYHIHRLRNRYTEPAPIDWEERFNHLCNRLGIQQSVALLQSGWVQVPVMLGSFKPVILVPLGMFTQIPTDQVEAVLIHELAHIRRKDYLVNLLQSFAEAVFFFNPGLRWLSSKMRQEREACCDDWVVAHTAQKTTYVEALVSFQEGLHNNRQYALALAGHKMHLLSRVKRMLTYENNKLNTMEKIFLLSGLVIFSAYGILRSEEPKMIAQQSASSNTIKEVKAEPQTAATVPTAQYVIEKQSVPVKEKKAEEQKQVKDTVPKKGVVYSHVYSDNDEGTKRSEVKFKDKSGKTYLVKRVNGKMTEFYINDKLIPESEWPAHQDKVAEIEAAMREQEEKAALKRKEMEVKRAAMEEKRKLMEVQREKLDEVRMLNEEKFAARRKEMEKDQQRLEEKRKLFSDKQKDLANKRKLFEQEHRELENKRKQMHIDMQKNKLKRDEVSTIINQFQKEGLINNTENLSFSLDNNALTINGKKLSADIHQRYKERYIHKSNDAISHSRAGNSSTTTIVKN